jgi:TonB-dependent receptor
MRHFQRTTLSIAAAQAALMFSGAALAQTTDTQATQKLDTVVVSGQRAALQSAQKIKQNSDEIVDSIVADDIGKLPDRSVTEVLQRVVGVTIDRTMSKGDPEHFSVEGSGVTIRGLSYVRSELNGRDSFSANGGRSLNFEDVPPELMAAVDVYKNPSAEQIEGAIGGLVNLRTALPFDFPGFKASVSVSDTYSKLASKSKPSASLLLSNRWNTDAGDFGLLVDLAHSESANRTDAFQVEPYYPLSQNGQNVWVPKGSQWRTLLFDRKRDGIYLAAQYKKSDVESSLTFFKSKYKMHWDENALFASSSPYNITVDPGATYSSTGAFIKGTLRDATDGGINFNDDVRGADRKSDTQDLAWHIKFRPAERWTVNFDAQYVRATTSSFDSTVATGVQMPKEQLDLSGSYPKITFDAADTARLADPANYYWAFTMEHMDKSKATEKAIKADAKYDFNDSFLNDIRFGVRLTDRSAVTQNSNPSYNWAAITQPWQVGWDISHLAYLNDPRFAGPTQVYTFNNFFNGRASVPALVFPAQSTATAAGFPGQYATLHSYHDILCAEQAAAQGWSSGCATWAPATFGTDPAGTNSQKEKTEAGFAQLRFGWEDLPMPIDGNLGLRVVHSNNTAHGYTVVTNQAPTIPSGVTGIGGAGIPNIANSSKASDFDNSYTDVLPSLNLRMKSGSDLQFRLAIAKAMTRPDFTQLQAYSALTQSTTSHVSGSTLVIDGVNQSGTASGNPMLKPTQSNQFDLTAEWYPEKSSSLTFALFDKQLKDVIVNQVTPVAVSDVNGTSYPFMTTAPINGAKGYARGFEVAFQKYFDKLPGYFAGIGIQANYTYVKSKTQLYNPVYSAYCSGSSGGADNLNLNLNGCDVDGRSFANLPLQNLSKNAFNLALLYDYGPISARVAYSWRSKYLQAVNVNGTQGTDGTDTNPNSATYGQHVIAWGLPTWADGYGELDASLFYKVTEKFQVGIEGQNLTDSVYKQLMQQHIGTNGRAWFVTGPRYTVQARYSF